MRDITLGETSAFDGSAGLGAPTVISLGFPVCPSAIVSAIGAVVINALDGEPRRRASTHVSYERFKRAVPLAANDDSATAVIGPTSIVGIVAPLSHGDPKIELRNNSSPPRHAVGGVVLPNNLLEKAAAASGPAVLQRAAVNFFLRSTLAAAEPLAPAPVSASYDGPPAKCLAGYVDGVWHAPIVNSKCGKSQ